MRRVYQLLASLRPSATAVNRLRRRRRRRPDWWVSFSALFLAVLGSAAHATSVTPPSFSELVGEAQVIARGTVTATEARWVDGPSGPVIKTFVTFAIEKRLKGNPPDTVTLEFLGGTVGSDTLKVGGMPQFTVGQSEILFVRNNGTEFCPLVRLMHGRYHIRTDRTSQRRYVSRDDGAPLASVNDVALPADDGGIVRAFRSVAGALAPEDFEAQVSAEANRQAR